MKKIQLTIDDLFNVPGAVFYEPDKLVPINFVSIDSRKIRKRSLFIAIKGERLDGHDFVLDAIKNGAAAVLINKGYLKRFDDVNIPIITVNDTTQALGDVARIWRKKLKAKIIGITGSTGKTTVKDMIAELLSEKYKVNKSEANNNNHIGVPLTILNTNENHEMLVAELGTNHFGEIPYTANILAPDYSLITNIGNSHLQFLKTKNGVWKEKSVLFDETIKNNGKVFLNYDDPIIKEKHSTKGKKVKFGFEGKVDVKGNLKSFTIDGKPEIEIGYKNKKHSFTLPLYGKQSAINFLAASAVALELGLTFEEIENGLRRLKAPAGRLNVQQYKNFILIDDTYNSNPDSAKSAIELAGTLKTFKRKILFLGDMLELGKNSKKLHESLEDVIAKSGIDEVYAIGLMMKYLIGKLEDKVLIKNHFKDRNQLINFIRNLNLNDSVILVKGSRGMKMEEFVSEIKTKSMN